MRTKIRNSIILFSALATLTITLWGCGSSNSNNNAGITCNAYGCYNSLGQPVSGTGVGTGVGGVVLQSSNMMVTNQTAWNTFLRSNQACNTMINSCSGLNGAPGITVNVYDTTFSGGFSQGNLTVEVQGGQLAYPNLYFRVTGSGFAAGIQTNPYIQINPNNTTAGAQYFIYITGSVSAANQQVAITTNGQTIASGTLVRIQ